MKLRFLILLGLFCWVSLSAHNFSTTEVHFRLADGRFRVLLIADLDAIALGQSKDVDNALLLEKLLALDPAGLAQTQGELVSYFQRRVRVRFDETPAPFEVRFPQWKNGARDAVIPTMFGTEVLMEGEIPVGAETVSFSASRSFSTIKLQMEDAAGTVGEALLIQGGTRSEPVSLKDLVIHQTRLQVIVRYLELGFVHILPAGADHILFVLGLFLICLKWKPLMLQVSAFTLAHTVTLGLSSYGIITLPSRPVEVLIAASIVYVAVENLITERVRVHRVIVVFLFGLLHGLGFAGVLGDLGLPSKGFFAALLSFNIGVELGQLSVICLAFLLVGRFREREWYRKRVVIPGSLLIGLVGMYWVVERLI